MTLFSYKETSFLLNLLSEKPDLVSKKLGGMYKRPKDMRKAWEEITKDLNAAGLSSAPKTTSEVTKKWTNLKYCTKKKYLRMEDYKKIVGGEQICSLTLTPIEKQVLNLIGSVTVVNGREEESVVCDVSRVKVEDVSNDQDQEPQVTNDQDQESRVINNQDQEPRVTNNQDQEPRVTNNQDQEQQLESSSDCQISDEEMEEDYIKNHLQILAKNISEMRVKSTERVKAHRERKRMKEDDGLRELIELKRKSLRIKEDMLKEEKRRNDLLEKILQKL